MVGIRGLFWGVTSLARYRITAGEHDEGDVASQPCHDRVSL